MSYQWCKDATSIEGETSSSLAISSDTLNTGTYYCNVSGGCGNVSSGNAQINVHPATVIIQHPADVNASPGETAEFSVLARGVNIVYQWRKDQGNIAGTDSTYTIASIVTADTGNYDCIVTGACGADTSEVAILLITTTEIGQLSDAGIRVYPNPTNDRITLESGKHQIDMIRIISLSGKTLIIRKDMKPVEIIDLSGIEKGFYIMAIQAQKKTFILKVIKE